jgi:hypothetical protein
MSEPNSPQHQKVRSSSLEKWSLWASIVECAAVVIGLSATFIAITLNSASINQSNQLQWRTYLDETSFNLDTQERNSEAIRCIYNWRLENIANLDDQCEKKIFGSFGELTMTLDYVETLLGFLNEVRSYSDQYDEYYYEYWYGGWANDLSEDPYGVVSFVLTNYANCNKAECLNRISLSIDDIEGKSRRFLELVKKNLG